MLRENGDIVFTCPQLPYSFDETIYETRGMGGSETALVEIARQLKRKTRRPVKVFSHTSEPRTSASGIEWLSANDQDKYFSRVKPRVHIAWRHNNRLTDAMTYLWAHDVFVETIEIQRNFDFMLCLSEFHKTYVHRNQFVPSRKIIVTRNGIDPQKFSFDRPKKNANKIVWMSSPDRGLNSALRVTDLLIQDFPNIELHLYYGFHLLYLYGLGREADDLKRMMSDRSYVTYHGLTEKHQMYQEVADAVVWLYPCNFLETFCITALEMLALGVFPVTRGHGALSETLRDAEQRGTAFLLKYQRISDEDIKAYAHAVSRVLKGRLWERVNLDLEQHSWSSIADEWIEFMGLTQAG